MIFTQYYLDCLSQASYLVADEGTGQAVVVDPRRDIREYVDDARARGLRIVGVINTHFHADFVSGHLELARETGAWIGYGEAAVADFSFLEPDHRLKITVSAGVATYPSNPAIVSAEQLIAAADRALYAAKKSGKNKVVVAPG